ncbi:hypothetical protein [uncultured Sphingomonas sp.]|uniref:hypothetical protein n=1 Tax=uncultured Sphingomonas sp. TaxID=158754 RepID=UPI0025D1C5A8|nr:hypothetical protein [uncultured Sphingomonas sp.]
MDLKTYLAAERIPYRTFADQIGVANPGVIAKYCSGARFPRPKILAAITRETSGKVTANDFAAYAAAE